MIGGIREATLGKRDVVLVEVREDAHADGGIAHKGCKPLAGDRIEPVTHCTVIREEPLIGALFVCSLAILHSKRHKSSCNLFLGRLELCCRHSARECDGLVELALEQRAHEHGHDIAAASREAGYRDILGVSAECLDVAAYPVECRCDVEEREVAGIIPEGREAVESEEAQAVAQRDVDT